MKPPKTVFVCQECGAQAPKWLGKCEDCGKWNTFVEERPQDTASAAVTAGHRYALSSATTAQLYSDIQLENHARLSTGINEFDRVLGGGVVPGSLVLLGGEPGIGKSTLLLQAAANMAHAIGPVLYSSGEESEHQIKTRGERLSIGSTPLYLLAETCLERILEEIVRIKPALVIVDSIQTVIDAGFEGSAGSVTQVRESAGRLMRLAKEVGVPIFLVGHVTKEGAIAGPRVLEHIVDTVLYLEGDRRQELRVLRAMKNRFGSAEEIGVFAMGEAGLEEVPDPSSALLSQATTSSPGTAIVAAIEGTRPLLIEIQSLVNKTDNAMVRRIANGVDVNRLHMLIAVIEKRSDRNLTFGKSDVYVNVAGGIRISEPAADLGLALSIVGNVLNVPLPDGTVAIGELGLAGEVRRVGQLERRLSEAARHGLKRALIPAGVKAGRPSGLDVIEVRTLAEAMSAAFSSHITSGAFIKGAGVSVS